MTKFKRDLNIARKLLVDELGNNIAEANQLWYGATRLTITLSSSFLLLTLAFVEKLFPKPDTFNDLPTALILSWLLLFISIIAGIVNEIDSSIFIGNSCRKIAYEIKKIDESLLKSITEDISELPSAYLESMPFFWGAVCVDAFVIAVLCMALSFLDKITPLPIIILILACGLIAVVILNVYLLKKRKHFGKEI